MKRTIITLGLVGLMSSCGIQFGDYERYKEINRKCWVADDGSKHTGQVEDYYYEASCENCDEID